MDFVFVLILILVIFIFAIWASETISQHDEKIKSLEKSMMMFNRLNNECLRLNNDALDACKAMVRESLTWTHND